MTERNANGISKTYKKDTLQFKNHFHINSFVCFQNKTVFGIVNVI